MKKKYSTLLNFALAGCLATTLVACGSDGDKTKGSNLPASVNQRGPIISIGGSVVDTNGNPLNAVTVSCQGTQALTNSSGQWVIHELQVINVQGVFEDTRQVFTQVKCVVEAPAGYLGAIVTVQPEAQMDSMYANMGVADTDFEGPPIVTFIDGMYAEAGSAWLPKLGSTVKGRLERCTSEEPIMGATVKLDLQSVDNNDVEPQAPNDTCEYGCSVDYSTAMYMANTCTALDVGCAPGTFSIANVPDDSILRLFVEGYTNISLTGKYEFTGSVGDTPDSTPDSEYITTVDEGVVLLGDVCADPITYGDDARPCVVGVTDYVHSEAGTQDIPRSNDGGWISPEFVRWFVLPDDVDGTGDGIAIVFNEYMDPTAVDENSVVIWNEGPDPGDSAAAKADDDYLTDFTATIEGNALRIVTAVPLGDDDHLKIYLLNDDFRDLAGNYLSAEDNRDNDVCDNERFVEDFWSLNDTAYVVVGVKMFSPDDTDVGEVTGLAQNCLDYSAVVDDQTDLQDEYPTTFRSDKADSNNDFFNLNKDSAYEDRLEALADVLECPNDTTYMADINPGYASVTFTAPTSGGWLFDDSGDTYCDDTSTTDCSGVGDGADKTVIVYGATVGDVVCIDSVDDFDNVSAHVCVPLGDCVAPTTVLNYAYNTCGHLGYDPAQNNNTEFHADGGGEEGPGYDTDYAAHLCVDFEAATLAEFGDGGENTAEGTPGECGIPTLNITCRLLKDPADAALGAVTNPITFYGLYDGTTDPLGTPAPGSPGPYADFVMYDATEFAIWTPFADTIGVAFSEDIEFMDGVGIPDIGWTGVTSITSISFGNNINTTDDGDSPDGGEAGSADLFQITVDDVLSLANDDHQEIMGFNDIVEDTSGNPADNAFVVINDLMPPFVEYAYWDGSLTIKFNETVAPCIDGVTTLPGVNCGGGSNSIVLWDVFGGADHISLDGATLSDIDGGTDNLLTIPATNLDDAGVRGDENFPQITDNSVYALVYDEPIYDTLGFAGSAPYAHGGMNWNTIPDARGNTWGDYDSSAGHDNVKYYDSTGTELCNMPSFAVADVLGPFTVTSVGTSGGFADGQPATCPTTHVMTYTFSHPIDLAEARWPGIPACVDSNACTLTEVNSFLDATWVNSNVSFNGTLLGSYGNLSGLSATLLPDRMSMTISIENDCVTFTSDDVLDPDWIVWSSFGVGTGKDLGAQVAQ